MARLSVEGIHHGDVITGCRAQFSEPPGSGRMRLSKEPTALF